MLSGFGKYLLAGLLLISILLILVVYKSQGIRDYKIFFATGKMAGEKILIIREFEMQHEHYYLGVNPDNLQTFKIPATNVSVTETTLSDAFLSFHNSPYVKAIEDVKKKSFGIENVGITHGLANENGAVLTIDLCPSKKPLDRNIFTSMTLELEKYQRPIPLTICITGKFMQSHPGDIEWLRGLTTKGRFLITWVNHTYNHYYSYKAPLKENFLLKPNVNLDIEILEAEIAMLERGLIPSVFFRFPGLVSDDYLVKRVIGYGLIPIGSDAWLAKGQKLHKGSIMLIHGNGNEPIGVIDFIRLLKAKEPLIADKKWRLFDLKESISNEYR